MFDSTRIKLTAWYLTIIMTVSFFFSFVIYRGLMTEVDRISRMERFRLESYHFGYRMIKPAFLDPEVIGLVKKRITVTLVAVNGIILVFSGGLGYFLAGKTLRPIAEMVKEQNRFITDASHELRTPLTSIKTAVEVGLKDPKLDLANAKKIIKENLIEINKLKSLSDGLLQLAQMKSSHQIAKHVKIQVKKIIDAAVSRVAPIALEKNISIIRSAGNHEITGDFDSLVDMVVILLDNSIKYSFSKSKIKINARQEKRSLLLTVNDYGIGIDKSDIPHIFDRFYRAGSARKKIGSGGYGLGLSIAKKIAESHNATISISSKINKGTTATVVFHLT